MPPRNRRLAALLLAALIAAAPGPARAGFDEGFAAYNAGDFAGAIDAFLPLAEAGDARAQYYLGHILYFGYGREPDLVGAARLYFDAARQGHAGAQYSLGRMIFNGEGVVRDTAKGAHWIRRAAEQGLPEAQFNLALLYRTGEGVAQDLGEAHFWCLLAAREANDELHAVLDAPCAEIALRLDPKARFDAEQRSWQWRARPENPAPEPGE